MRRNSIPRLADFRLNRPPGCLAAMSWKAKKGKRRLYLILAFALSLSSIIFGSDEWPLAGGQSQGWVAAGFGCSHAEKGRILRGVRVSSVDVGGLTIAEAREKIRWFIKKVVMQPLTLRSGELSWRLDPTSLGIEVLVDAALAKACAIGRTGSLIARLRERYRVARWGAVVPMEIVADEERLRAFLFGLAMEVNRDPRDAFLVIEPDDTVRVVEAREGRWLDMASSMGRMKEALFRREGREVILDVRVLEPRVSTEKVMGMGIKRLLGSYATRFDPGDGDRSYNIRIGAGAIDGYMIPPGGVFSFNAVVGPRSQEYGYREAPVVMGSELIPGIGGGVCQVSSTLYNAALLSGLEIVARSNHSLAPSYVPPGRDATVAYNYLDLKIKNTTDSHVLIRALVQNDSLIIKLFGDRPANEEISIVTEVEEKIPPPVIEREDPKLNAGERRVEEQGAFGYVVKTWRVVKVNGVEVRRELISRDRYKPRPVVLRIGVKAQATEELGYAP